MLIWFKSYEGILDPSSCQKYQFLITFLDAVLENTGCTMYFSVFLFHSPKWSTQSIAFLSECFKPTSQLFFSNKKFAKEVCVHFHLYLWHALLKSGPAVMAERASRVKWFWFHSSVISNSKLSPHVYEAPAFSQLPVLSPIVHFKTRINTILAFL